MQGGIGGLVVFYVRAALIATEAVIRHKIYRMDDAK